MFFVYKLYYYSVLYQHKTTYLNFNVIPFELQLKTLTVEALRKFKEYQHWSYSSNVKRSAFYTQHFDQSEEKSDACVRKENETNTMGL